MAELKAIERPGPLKQKLNRIVHHPPVTIVLNTLFWTLILTCILPLASVVVLCKGIYDLYQLYAAPSNQLKPKDDADTAEYAILITGCDSGIGKEAAVHLLSEGFVVFCGCLTQEAMKEYRLDSNAKPLLMDVTKQSQVDDAAMAVTQWLAGSDGNGKTRYFHALINNAGIGRGGLIDWIGIETFEMNMNVNCYGMIRTCKAFTPLLKKQVAEKGYKRSQILNVVSMAGMVPSPCAFAPAYEVSKHAAHAFCDALRYEMQWFNVQVVTVNPTFHTTPLITNNTIDHLRSVIWDPLTKEKQEQYGRSFFDKWNLRAHTISTKGQWDVAVLAEDIARTVAMEHPPAQLLVGTDAKFGCILFIAIPQWIRHALAQRAIPIGVPAFTSKVQKAHG
uniref:Uncharacterized protein n=1 Tax=Craspedostauros australis TaxID=1486917 RepID=A0A7R9WR27_9STRA|mmetsp:Transcript_14889/g.41249  ORF Transcript_14889/g.41249 Transcript_14889/m.41249 type:complete len:391 (+) Transcript_14889:158-1330(+)|eukprot:CAMPEP_0198108170 /NCGR_PEP_ID=MMETSP1442-20131203/255_1 /TAXON_ID= /ORGANISM="Craspedostauros australis, Strain CCMP3328" /LENGTH=390 /DNA_ID=CAMNT_0043763393 /DNA_START=140 /DNA_END=1312 /DNA_ORIENTATION=-